MDFYASIKKKAKKLKNFYQNVYMQNYLVSLKKQNSWWEMLKFLEKQKCLVPTFFKFSFSHDRSAAFLVNSSHRA